MRDTREERFWSKVDKNGPTMPHMDTNCWEWKGCLFSHGYGSFRYRSEQSRAHRVSWQINVGDIPPDMLVCHACDNRKCVRPDHLFIGTYLDNNSDRAAKGRSYDGRGENCPTHKLSKHHVAEIFRLLGEGLSQRKISMIMGCSSHNVSLIARGKTWKNFGNEGKMENLIDPA